MRPNRLIVRAYLARSARLWFLARLSLGGARFFFDGGDPIHLTRGMVVVVIVVGALLGVVELRRHHERALLGNLAVGRGTIALLLVAPPLVAEVVLSLVLRVR